jgi:hypothetical protein
MRKGSRFVAAGMLGTFSRFITPIQSPNTILLGDGRSLMKMFIGPFVVSSKTIEMI